MRPSAPNCDNASGIWCQLFHVVRQELAMQYILVTTSSKAIRPCHWQPECNGPASASESRTSRRIGPPSRLNFS
jgi:hypothetical protein